MTRGSKAMVAAWVLAMLVLTGVGVETHAIEIRELTPIVDSFRQLAFWDADAAGDVWMTGQATDTWNRFVRTALPNQIATISLFTHCILMGDVATDGTPIAGLFDPWTGTLIVLAFADTAATVETVAIEIATEGLTERANANQTAMALMEAIGLASDRMAEYSTQPWSSLAAEEDWQQIAERLVMKSAQLRLVYPAATITDPALILAQALIDKIQSGDLSGLLGVVEDADPLWLQSLLPIYATSIADGIVVVLGSSIEPLDLVWLSISNDSLQQVSWIRLFDRVLTQTGGES